MHDNSWLTTLPFDVDDTGCHTPPSQRSDISSKLWKYYQVDYLVPNNYTSFTQMLSLLYIYVTAKFPNMFLIPQHLRIFQHIDQHQHGDHRILANAWEYGIWNATIASLQFWTEDLDPVTLGIASECVYTHFFWTSTSHTQCQLSEEALFGHSILALNSAFTQQLSLADDVYESGSNEDLLTP